MCDLIQDINPNSLVRMNTDSYTYDIHVYLHCMIDTKCTYICRVGWLARSKPYSTGKSKMHPWDPWMWQGEMDAVTKVRTSIDHLSFPPRRARHLFQDSATSQSSRPNLWIYKFKRKILFFSNRCSSYDFSPSTIGRCPCSPQIMDLPVTICPTQCQEIEEFVAADYEKMASSGACHAWSVVPWLDWPPTKHIICQLYSTHSLNPFM